MKHIKFYFAVVMLVLMAGCAQTVSPAAQKQLQQLTDQQAIAMKNLQATQATALAKMNETLKENAAKGEQAPTSNPIAATDNTVRELHPWLMWASGILAVAAVLCLALSAIGPAASSVPWLTWMKPLGEIAQVIEPAAVRSFCITFAALMLLPFIKVTAICGIVALVALFIYEMVINKGNLQTVISSMVKLVTGVGGASPVAITNVSGGVIK